MKRPYFIIILLLKLQIINIEAQNFVPDPSFENSDCTTGLTCCTPIWKSPNNETTDVFNADCLTDYKRINNLEGWQLPHSGKSYLGIRPFIKTIWDYREYISAKLIDTLTKNKIYYIGFYYNVANEASWFTDDFGMFIGHQQPQWIPVLDMYIPQLRNPEENIARDTLNWQVVQGFFTAQGGEEYVTIGNFSNDLSTTMEFFQNNTQYDGSGYLQIDDVMIIPCETAIPDVFLGNDTVVCNFKFPFILGKELQGANYLWNDGSENAKKTINTS